MTTVTGRKSPKPIQARAEETRNRVLSEARKAFADNGFDGANTRDISAAAGVAHTAIRYHFGTKEQLWREVIDQMFGELETHMASALDGFEDDVDMLRRFVHGYVAYCAKSPEHARIMIAETARGGERLTWMVDEYIRVRHVSATAAIKRVIEARLLPDVPLPSLIYSITAMSQAPFVLAKELKAIYGVDFFDDACVKAHADAVLTILLLQDAG